MNALQGIFTNAVALNAQRNLGVSQNSLAGIQAQLSSGLRINGARDDAAGLAISERLQANLKAQDSSIRSINQGISLVQVADGGLMNISESLQRGFELAVQAANGTLAASDRANLNAEFRQLHAEIDRIAEGTEIFGRYPTLMADHELMEFLCDYLRLVISGNTDPFEIEALMDHEIETIRHEAAVPQHSLAGVADALPALGIVAAVSSFLAQHKGWITEASHHADPEAMRFFMRQEILADSLPFGIAAFRDKFFPIAREFDMDWSISDSARTWAGSSTSNG